MEVQLDYIRLYAVFCAMKTEIYFLTKLKGMMLDLVSAVSDGLPCQVAALQIEDMTNEDTLGYLLKNEDSVLPFRFYCMGHSIQLVLQHAAMKNTLLHKKLDEICELATLLRKQSRQWKKINGICPRGVKTRW
ncbi:MAG: hypothetical protein EZS28_034243 [Streblomastix strix]|uniref:DUF659 domain-containing protein n=1 Tax=Streblomastix strix TaxID=222440 RepID=A0A5J4UJK3_9EUKA|nr:MAG: hypothetical protein EZS28_034243 [Streblomastix strix]